jgi:hypothetical protein
MTFNEDYEKHIKDIQMIKHDFSNYTKMFKNTAKSMSIVGSINLLLFVTFTFLVQLYMTRGTNIFDGFKWYHHILWISIILLQVIYILYLILYPINVTNLMDGVLYDIFTVDIIVNGHFEISRLWLLIKNLFKAILLEPIMEYILLIAIVMIPWPFLKNISYSKRIQMILMKAGIFNVIISLTCMNYDSNSDQFLQIFPELESPGMPKNV